jgi:AbrB family looped-hinge helix DNA binding protein
MMEYRTKISAKGQVVIPKEIRERYGFNEGVEIIIRPLKETTLLIERAPRLPELFGFMGEAKTSDILLEEREKELKAERRRSREIMPKENSR